VQRPLGGANEGAHWRQAAASARRVSAVSGHALIGVALDPVDVRFLGANGVALSADDLPDLVEQFGLTGLSLVDGT